MLIYVVNLVRLPFIYTESMFYGVFFGQQENNFFILFKSLDARI